MTVTSEPRIVVLSASSLACLPFPLPFTVIVDNTYPLGTLTIWEPDDYARMLELRDPPPDS
jgi:hypothetical protein